MRSSVLALAAFVPVAFSTAAAAKMVFIAPPDDFQMISKPLATIDHAKPTVAHIAGSRIAAVDNGALALDADSGRLLLTDRAGNLVDSIAIGTGAGLFVYDAVERLAYVADRSHDKIVCVHVGAKLAITRSWPTPVEPYGVALAPDRKSLLVTAVADRALVSFDPATGGELWRIAIASEPRNVAISPDGTQALIAHIADGKASRIDLKSHAITQIELDTARTPQDGDGDVELTIPRGEKPMPTLQQQSPPTPPSFARANFTVAFMGEHEAIIPYQRETPIQRVGASESPGRYGGGFDPPIVHQIAFVTVGDGAPRQATARIATHQPRAVAWDGAHDAVYVAGYGNDMLQQITDATKVPKMGVHASLAARGVRCGPDGVAIAPNGDAWVWCSFTRSVIRVATVDAKGVLADAAKQTPGPTLIASAMPDNQHAGMILFASADSRISQRAGLACASCHPEGRDDGLSWRIEKHDLQTPLLAGRLVGTAPYKWDGTDATLEASMASTMRRLGGAGLSADESLALAAYLEGLPAPRTPTRDAQQVARGKAIFDSSDGGCRGCHDGDHYTDDQRHKLTGTLEQSDTPSLIGLAASAPYFHDGSAPTIEDVLRDRGKVHGMADLTSLKTDQVADLTAYLETL